MDVIAKKELGWIVPNVLPAGQSVVNGWTDSKVDTGIINWVTPDGTPYTLDASGGDRGIHNGQAYAAALPGRQLIDPAKVTNGKSVWFSGSGNDFGCAPIGGHNFDVAIPGIENARARDADHGDLPVVLRHRVGLRLRLHDDRQAGQR